MMRAGGENVDGLRLRGLIVVLWRAGLRITEALALAESDYPARGAILVRRGSGAKRREVGMDRRAWEQLAPWLSIRAQRTSSTAITPCSSGRGAPHTSAVLLASQSERPELPLLSDERRRPNRGDLDFLCSTEKGQLRQRTLTPRVLLLDRCANVEPSVRLFA